MKFLPKAPGLLEWVQGDRYRSGIIQGMNSFVRETETKRARSNGPFLSCLDLSAYYPLISLGIIM